MGASSALRPAPGSRKGTRTALTTGKPSETFAESHCAALRRALAPELEISDLECQRFLRANAGRVPRAAKQYRATAAWREREGIDGVMAEPPFAPEVEAELARGSMQLLDDYGSAERPVAFALLDRVDLRALKRLGITTAMLLRRHAKLMEQLVARLEAAANPLAGHVLIVDVSGCSAGKLVCVWPYLRKLAHMSQAYYPEVLGTLCVVNGHQWGCSWPIPKLVPVRPLLPSALRKKVALVHGDLASVLLEYGHGPQAVPQPLPRANPPPAAPATGGKGVAAAQRDCQAAAPPPAAWTGVDGCGSALVPAVATSHPPAATSHPPAALRACVVPSLSQLRPSPLPSPPSSRPSDGGPARMLGTCSCMRRPLRNDVAPPPL